jgi:hypothetical protein
MLASSNLTPHYIKLQADKGNFLFPPLLGMFLSTTQIKLIVSSPLLLILSKMSSTSADQTSSSIAIATDEFTNDTYCNLNCNNGGYCTFVKYTNYPQVEDIGFYEACACQPGFRGNECQNIVEECAAPHFKCNNGSPCKRQNGELVCDCSFADQMSDEAGAQCRESTVEYCDTRDVDIKSFCVNGGKCVSDSIVDMYENLVVGEPKT